MTLMKLLKHILMEVYMANLNTHYKERTPMETVNIIKKFFKDNGYTLKQTESR